MLKYKAVTSCFFASAYIGTRVADLLFFPLSSDLPSDYVCSQCSFYNCVCIRTQREQKSQASVYSGGILKALLSNEVPDQKMCRYRFTDILSRKW